MYQSISFLNHPSSTRIPKHLIISTLHTHKIFNSISGDLWRWSYISFFFILSITVYSTRSSHVAQNHPPLVGRFSGINLCPKRTHGHRCNQFGKGIAEQHDPLHYRGFVRTHVVRNRQRHLVHQRRHADEHLRQYRSPAHFEQIRPKPAAHGERRRMDRDPRPSTPTRAIPYSSPTTRRSESPISPPC